MTKAYETVANGITGMMDAYGVPSQGLAPSAIRDMTATVYGNIAGATLPARDLNARPRP